MAKKFSDCVASAIRGGIITPEQGQQVLGWYDHIRAQGGSDSEAKVQVADRLMKESAKREANALLTAEKISDLDREGQAFRNAAGEVDQVLAHKLAFFRRGDEGKFQGLPADRTLGLSVHEIEQSIKKRLTAMLDEPAYEFRRGAISGDKKRTSKVVAMVSPGAQRTQARLFEVVKAMRGEKTEDARAQELGDIIVGVSEYLRQRFNKAGGMIGKLEGWGGPQWHNPQAILQMGMDAWVKFIMPMLDRDRMVHTLTGQKLSDAELIEGLQVSWKRITSNGQFDEEMVTGVPIGKGALWTQHADHRFLHFKSAEAWMTYAKRFGNPDPWAAFVNWSNTMARDIAAMEKFGPNPDYTVRYREQVLMARAESVKPTEVLIREEKAAREADTIRLRDLQRQMLQPNPEWERLTDRHAAIIDELNALRHSRTGMSSVVVGAWNRDPGPEVKALRDRMTALQMELADTTTKLLDMKDRGEEHLIDVAVRQEYTDLLDEMSAKVQIDPIKFAETNNPGDYARTMIEKSRTLWNLMRGSNGVPESFRQAEITQMVRGYVSMTALPMAVLSALADPVFQTTKRGLLGMSAAKANPISVLIDSMRNMSTASRREAAQSMVILDSVWQTVRQESADSARLAKTRAAIDYMQDRVHAIGLLSPYTTGGKISMEMAVMAHLANSVGQAWDKLDAPVRDLLERGGFDVAAWDKIRRAKLYEPRPDAPFLRATEIMDVAPDLAERYLAMVGLARQYGIIEPTPESRAFLLGNTKPGTLPGDALRLVGTLKGFPIAVLFMWWGQMSNDIRAGNHRSAAATAASLMIVGAFMGAMTMMLKDVAAGRDPRKFLDENTYLDGNFWMAAMLQAGGLGIYGDFLFSEVNRQGGSMAQTLAGPVVDRIDALKKLTVDNVVQAARGKDTHVMRELFRVLRQNTPTVLWNKMLMERMVFDRLQLMADPEARQGWQRERNKRKTDFGQEYWFGPGDLTAQRAPDLSRMFATRK